MMTRPFLALALISTLMCCKEQPMFKRLDDGVIVYPKEVNGAVRIRVISEDIIQVRATSKDTLPKDESLMVIAEAQQTGWDVLETTDDIKVITPNVKAVVSLRDGHVTFRDALDHDILVESERAFEPFLLDSLNTHHIRQTFRSPDDEAFYGLGGHQNGQMNYKGQDVDLLQHNIVDVVPFLLSSR